MFYVYFRANIEFRSVQHSLIDFITEVESVYCVVRTGSLK